jgi:transcriptional regulator with XRE-family HTH domain
MNDEVRRTELARFLRARRAAKSPDEYGLPVGRRRRTPGLRREEVALRANVGVTWYTWLEQSRDIQVSRDALKRIATALNLSSSDRAYLESLALDQSTICEETRDEALTEVQEILDGFTAGPAMLWNYRYDCIAYNRIADLVYDWTDSPEPFGRNLLWRAFLDPVRNRMYSEAERALHNSVGMLRSRYAEHLGEPEFESLVKVLLAESKLFAALWTEQHTASNQPVRLVLTHPTYGRLSVRSIRAIFQPIPDSTLVFVNPLDDSSSAILRALGDR